MHCRSTSPPSRGQDRESQPWALVSSQAEGGPSHTERPTKKPRSEKAPDGNKEDVSAMIGSLDEIAARLESIQERPELVCKRKAHMRDPEEASRPPAKWRARCGWPYGYSNFTRAHDDGTQVLCLKCFPETAQGSRKTEAAAQQPDTESTDSYDSSSSS